MGTSSAIPANLLRYRAEAQDIDDGLTAAAMSLGSALDRFRAGDPEFMGPIPALDGDVRDLARRSSTDAEWVAMVGRAFAAAGGRSGPFGFLDFVVGDAITVDDDVLARQLADQPAIDLARADAAELQRLLESVGGAAYPGASAWNEEELLARYGEISDLMRRILSRSSDDTYAGTLVSSLGADGIRGLLNVFENFGMQEHWSPDRSRDPYADMVRPLAIVFARATRSGRADATATRLLDVETMYEQRQLALLMSAGRHEPDFARRAAEKLLVDNMDGYLNNLIGPMAFVLRRPELASNEVIALRALGRNHEAAFLFATSGDNHEFLLRPGWPSHGDRRELEAAAGRVLEIGLAEYPDRTRDRAVLDRAGETLVRVMVDAGEGDVPDLIKRSLAAVAGSGERIDRITRAIDRNRVGAGGFGDNGYPGLESAHAIAFFKELAHDDDALAILIAGATAYGHNRIAAAVDQVVEGGTVDVDRVNDEAGAVGDLFGVIGSGITDARVDAETRQALLVGSFEKIAMGVGAAGITVSPLTGGASAVAGLTLRGVVELGGELVGSSTEYRGRDEQAFVSDIQGSLHADIARIVYDNPEARAALAPDAPAGQSFEEWVEGSPHAADVIRGIFDRVDGPMVRGITVAGGF